MSLPLSLSLNPDSPSGSATASRRRKRRRRSSSVFTSASASTEISKPDAELETAKAAAMKLLENSPVDSIGLNPAHFGPDPPRNTLDALLPPKPKKTRFEDITTILEEPESVADTTRQKAATTVKQPGGELSPQCCLIGPSRDRNQQQKLSVNHHIIAPATKLTQSSLSDGTQTEVFQVNRDEIFSDNSIVDAFNAAMLEFQFFRLKQSTTQLGNPSIKTPHSRVEKRQCSALYYGKPPPCPPIRNKKPPIHSIFTAPVPPSPSISKDTSAPTPVPPPRASPVCSELDMDEYMDMFGQPSSPEPADASAPAPPPRTSPAASELDMDEYMDMLEQSPSPEPPAGPPCAAKDGAQLPTSVLEVDKQSDTSSGSSSGTKNGASDPASTTTAPTSVHSPTPCPPASEQLSAAQKALLSNALNAQYWAGYHTALFNRSIGIGVEVSGAQDAAPDPAAALAQSAGWDAGKLAAASAPLSTG